MKKIIALIAIAFIGFTSLAQEKFSADLDKSVINWKGFKPTGSHHGIIKLSNGYFNLNGDKIVGGEFTIDMNSIVDLDMPADNEYNAKLVNHLKSADFFEVETYPTAKFKVTGSEQKGNKTLIKGDLTIKDKTNAVSFLAEVNQSNNQLMVKSDIFKLNRAQYNVKYKSKSFYNDLKDKFIDDDIEISILVEASK